MNVTTEIDLTKFNAQLGALSDALLGSSHAGDRKQGDGATIIKDESRRLLKQIIKFTPPKNQKQGRDAVQRDIGRAMTPIRADDFEIPYVKKMIETDDRPRFAKWLASTGTWKSWMIHPFSKDLHKKARDNRGRVRRSRKDFVWEVTALMRYIREMQKRVGMMKAGWYPAFQAVGGKVAGWISRHKQPHGFVILDLVGLKPSITIGNRANGINTQCGRQVREALRARAEAIGKRIRLIQSNYARNVKDGIRVKRAATMTSLTEAGE